MEHHIGVAGELQEESLREADEAVSRSEAALVKAQTNAAAERAKKMLQGELTAAEAYRLTPAQQWEPKIFEKFKIVARKKAYQNRSSLKWENKQKGEEV